MRKYRLDLLFCIFECMFLCSCTFTLSKENSLNGYYQKCICFGKTLYLDCRSDYLAFVRFSLGIVPNTTVATDCGRDSASCFEYPDTCMMPMPTDHKLIFYRRFSAYTRSLDIRTGPRQRVPASCQDFSLDGFTNYAQFNYTCVKENFILDMCSPYISKVGEMVFVRHFPEKDVNRTNSQCRCTAYSVNNDASLIQLLAVDVRLTSGDGNCTWNHSVHITDGNTNETLPCISEMLLGEFSEIYNSTTGSLSVTLDLDGLDGEPPESVWFAYVGETAGEITVFCGDPSLEIQTTTSRSTTFTTTTADITTTKHEGKTTIFNTIHVEVKTPKGKTNTTSSLNEEESGTTDFRQSIMILIYICISVVGLLVVLIGTVCLRMYVKRRHLRKRHLASISGLKTFHASTHATNSEYNYGFEEDTRLTQLNKEYTDKPSYEQRKHKSSEHAKVYYRNRELYSAVRETNIDKSEQKPAENKTQGIKESAENIKLDKSSKDPEQNSRSDKPRKNQEGSASSDKHKNRESANKSDMKKAIMDVTNVQKSRSDVTGKENQERKSEDQDNSSNRSNTLHESS